MRFCLIRSRFWSLVRKKISNNARNTHPQTQLEEEEGKKENLTEWV